MTNRTDKQPKPSLAAAMWPSWSQEAKKRAEAKAREDKRTARDLAELRAKLGKR